MPSPEQELAIRHPLGGAALVFAGAGSGKTTVLTHRVAHMVQEVGLHPRSVICVTFTNKAAGEMLHRVCKLLGVDPMDQTACPRISTIHSLSLSAIRKNPRGFGLSDRVSPIDTGDQKDLLRKLIEDRKKDPKFAELDMYKFLERMQYHRARGTGFAVDYTEEIHKAAQKAHRGYHALMEAEHILWRDYEEAKTKASVVDFDDMLHLVVRRGRADDAWRTGLQKQFATVLLDEAQDSNHTQWEFIDLILHPDNHNLFAVGDISQSIYAFSGAAPEILGAMVDGWRGRVPKLFKLEDNYRSLGKIVRFANRIQSSMTGTVPLTMKTKRTIPTGDGTVTRIVGATSRDIAEQIAENIVRDNRLKTGEFKFKDNAILVRSASQVRDIEPALVHCRIPYVVRGGQSLFQTEEARDLFAYLKLITNPSDAVAFTRAVSTPSRGIGDATVAKLQNTALAKFGGDMIQAAASSGHMKLQPFGQFLQELLAMSDPVDILNKVIKFTGYADIIRSKYRAKAEVMDAKLNNLDKITEAIAGIMAAEPMATATDVIFRITMDQKAEAEKEEGAVVVSTIHSAKGLEWPRVFVTNLYEGSLPHQWSSTDKEIEEERRLFYVAVTRSRDVTSLCIPAMVQRGPNTARVQPSRFLVELGVV